MKRIGKVIIYICAGLFFLGILGAIFSGGNDDDSAGTVSATSTTESSPQQPAEPPKPEPVQNWEYGEEEDKMTSKMQYTAYTISKNEHEFDFPYGGGTSAALLVRQRDGNTDLLYSITKGQFISGIDGGYLRMRFDDAEPIRVSFSPPADHSSTLVFINSEQRVLALLKKSKRLIVETEFYQEGSRQFEFNIEGLKWEH